MDTNTILERWVGGKEEETKWLEIKQTEIKLKFPNSFGKKEENKRRTKATISTMQVDQDRSVLNPIRYYHKLLEAWTAPKFV